MLLKLLMGGTIAGLLGASAVGAQEKPQAPRPSRETLPPPALPESPIPTLPPPPIDLLIPDPRSSPNPAAPDAALTLIIDRFEITGSTVFTQAELAQAIAPFRDREISLTQVFQEVPAAILKLYEARRFIGTQVVIPPQPTGAFQQGSRRATIAVTIVEQGIQTQDIEIVGTRRLRPDYVRSRLAIAAGKPLNRQGLLEALQLLQLNPLIQTINAELSDTQDGRLFLKVTVGEAKTLSGQVGIDNRRSPSVGSFRRFLQFNQANLTGLGDALSIVYTNTSGSNSGELSYTLPVNPRNGTVNFNVAIGASKVVEEPFDFLDIRSRSTVGEFTYRQPLLQTPTRELALGVTVSHQFSRATLVDGDIPFPTRGSDFEGNTRVTALRVFQDWSQGSDRAILALRSQFTVGLNILGSTTNEAPPDGRYFSWRGQVQWARRVPLFAPDTLLLVRGDLQLSDRALIPLEQFGLGGQLSVRGYRQDALLGDNGAFGSVELRVPVLRLPAGGLQVAPFAEIGHIWNRSPPKPDPNTLASVGLGLRLQLSDRLNARFDYGIPLISIQGNRDTWQERGLYFSVVYNPF